MDDVTRGAFEQLLKTALGYSGQCRRVAGFILAWWNGADHSGFDIADLFALDRAIATDMATIISFLARQDFA